MSDQSKIPHQEGPEQGEPGKRLEKRAKPVLTTAQARKKKEKRIMIVMIVAAVVMVLAAAAVVAYNHWFQEPELPPVGPVQSDVPDPTALPGESDDPNFVMDTVEPKVGGERKSDKIFTILIFGTDTTSGLTDTMMVATYDVTHQKAAVMSLPRDTLINSSARPGIDAKKLNAVFKVYGYGEKGAEALKNEVAELVGFTPDYYVQIDWELVGEMVDAIGGVWFDNPRHMEYYDPFQDLNIYQEKGYRKLSGDDAMQIVRFRHSNDGTAISDLERLSIQHEFLKAVLKQTLQIGNLTRIDQIIRLFESRVESDLDVKNMLWFGKEAVMGGLQVDDVEFLTMPTVLGQYGGRDFVYPVQSELLAMTNEFLNPFVEQVTIRQLDLMSVAPNGGLRSSTGRLAEPSLATPPVVNTPKPEESDPAESNPLESGEPQGSAPVATEPPPSSPVDTMPPASLPVESEPPATAAVEPEPLPTQAEGEDPIDWGETPE